MPSYRFHKLSGANRIFAPGHDHDFEDDLAALEHARMLADGYAIGVWEGARCVAYVSVRRATQGVREVVG